MSVKNDSYTLFSLALSLDAEDASRGRLSTVAYSGLFSISGWMVMVKIPCGACESWNGCY